MKIIRLKQNEICRAFQTFADACNYIQTFVPEISMAEVVKVIKENKGSAFSFIFYKNVNDRERVLFERNFEDGSR